MFVSKIDLNPLLICLQHRHLELARSRGNEVEEQRAWATIGQTHIFRHKAEADQGSDEAGGDSQKHPGVDNTGGESFP